MIASMTGFGKASIQLEKAKYAFEIRSLNSKQLDLNMRLPNTLRIYEGELRRIVSEHLTRGKVDITLNVESTEVSSGSLNLDVLTQYVRLFKNLAQQEQIETDALAHALRMPEVLNGAENALPKAEWLMLQGALIEALHALNIFRNDEGAILAKDLKTRIENIGALAEQIKPLEAERVQRMKEKLEKALESAQLKQEVDNNRLEQELIYYLEKFDVTEEQIRLRSHLDYFLSEMENQEHSGRKLGFISQEIGREINTLGSKANHATMQKIVVMMKDELEKIKEQLLNVL